MTKKKREKNQEQWKTAIIERFPSASYAPLPTVFIDVRQDDEDEEDDEDKADKEADFRDQLTILQNTVSQMKRYDCKDITAVKLENDQLKAENETFKLELEAEQKRHKEEEAKLRHDLKTLQQRLQDKEEALKKWEASLRKKNGSQNNIRDQKNMRRKGRSRHSTNSNVLSQRESSKSESSSMNEEEMDEVCHL